MRSSRVSRQLENRRMRPGQDEQISRHDPGEAANDFFRRFSMLNQAEPALCWDFGYEPHLHAEAYEAKDRIAQVDLRGGCLTRCSSSMSPSAASILSSTESSSNAHLTTAGGKMVFLPLVKHVPIAVSDAKPCDHAAQNSDAILRSFSTEIVRAQRDDAFSIVTPEPPTSSV